MNITIVGGGFGGVKSALELAENKKHNITLISDKTQFQYYPALFSTATGHSYKESWVPLSEIFAKKENVRVVIDSIVSLDSANNVVISAKGKSYKYDKIIFAMGSVTTYFGIKGLDEYSFGIKSESEIRALQNHIVRDMSDGKEDEIRYVIIGAGPTGVELAGALGEYIRVLRKKYGIKKQALNITLLEAGPRVLGRLSEKSSDRALKQLRKLGVKVRLNAKVLEQTPEGLIIGNKLLKTQTVIWTSGVANVPFYTNNPDEFTLDNRGKVIVDEHMKVSPNVYVIGDNANTPYAGLAQTALHDALYVTKHICGKDEQYEAVLPPCVVPVGHKWAVFDWKKLQFSGYPAHIMRRLADLVGYSDVLPISWAIGAWRASTRRELMVPDTLNHPDNQ